MLDNPFQKFIFHLTSLVTTWFPRFGAWFFNTVIPPIAGNKLLISHLNKKNLKVIRNVKKFDKILIIPDIHLGDAILAQGGIKAFKDFFPNAKIDYIVNKLVAPILEGNPDIHQLHAVFAGGHFPTEVDLESVRRIAASTDYDLCFNCSPFFENTSLFPKDLPILNFLSVAPSVVRNEIDKAGNVHIAYNGHAFPSRLLSQSYTPARKDPYAGVSLYLSDQAMEEAQEFLAVSKIDRTKPIFFVNPDTASPFTRVPNGDMAKILKGLAAQEGSILLGVGFTAKNIENELLDLLTESEKAKVTFVPARLRLDSYCALIDLADVFISGDTGPLHMGAARKVARSDRYPVRNKTFVISIFGATPPRLSGYDSVDPLYLAANQDVLSRTYISESPCRNITCVNKMAKTCQKIRCYEFLDTDTILADIRTFLKK